VDHGSGNLGMAEVDRKVTMSIVGKVFRTPERRLNGLLARCRDLGVATLAASLDEPWGRHMVIAVGALERVSGSGVVAGHAITVWNAGGNNTMIKFGIAECTDQDVLLVSCPTDSAAQWGDVTTEYMRASGTKGVIVDGSVRDVAEIRKSGVSVWARTIDPRSAAKELLGYVNGPIRVGGVTVNSGDLVVADDDAVMAIPAKVAEEVVGRGEARAASEDAHRTLASQGIRSNLHPKVTDERVEFVEETWHEWSAGREAFGPSGPES
jgi:4-hydroxy-4-methyl-2-oxoglutarate aldolase